MIVLVVVLPLIIGGICGVIAGYFLKMDTNKSATMSILTISIILTSCVGFFFNYRIMPSPILNFMLIGMAFSAAFSNIVSEERLENIMSTFNPVLGIAMIIVILNLGAPLDYHLILGAGLFTAVYILSRAFGKYFGAYFGASITKSPETVKKYLGFTLLPHSGVSLVFTGIAVSVLAPNDPNCAQIVQGTIAAAAVINEVIAVIIAKKGFEWANELSTSQHISTIESTPNTIITINRQYGSGGRDIAKLLSVQLNIPFYDGKIIEMAAQNSNFDKTDFENYELSNPHQLLTDLSDGVSSHITKESKIFDYHKDVIEKLARDSSCIIVGRCADYVLKDYPNLINVFIYGDFKQRIRRAVEVYNDDPETVVEKTRRMDKKRSTYHIQYTGLEFGNAENYDVCLNSTTLGINECVNIIKNIYIEKKA